MIRRAHRFWLASSSGNNCALAAGEDFARGVLGELELRAEIEAMANDLYKQFEDTDAWRQRYPGW
ncbi:MAG: hypothetical protein AB7U82_25670 [Blastocatellales bacterium]